MGSARAIGISSVVATTTIALLMSCSSFGEEAGSTSSSSSGGSSSGATTDAAASADAPVDDESGLAVPDAGGTNDDVGAPSCGERALRFDGLGVTWAEAAHHEELDLKTEFTVEAWVKPEAMGPPNEGHIVSHHNHSGSSGWVLLIKEHRAEFRIYGELDEDSAHRTAGAISPIDYVTDGEWAHVAATFKNGQISLFWNGQRIGSTVGLSGLTRRHFNGELRIGRAASGANPNFGFRGAIDEVRISSIERYPTPTFAVPTERFTVASDVIALYHADEPNQSTLLNDAAMSHQASASPSQGSLTFEDAPCIADRR